MKWIRTPDNLAPEEQALVGGKAFRLAQLQHHGFKTAPWVCVTTRAYDAYLDTTGLRERMALELHRKAFEEMRWEELWDCATRIRHMFLKTPMPEGLLAELKAAVQARIGGQAVAVRSSAIDEDNPKASFAGLHASYINVRGIDAIVRHVHLVWASLWSDAALLYRREIGLDVTRSAMAVLVQALVAGSSSGVAFSVHPVNPRQAVIEAVHGLNQGLVDGAIEPDRWIIERDSRKILSHSPGHRQFYMIPDRQDIRKAELPKRLVATAPLSSRQVLDVCAAALKVETAFGVPQDVEWTITENDLILLQARPITTRPGSGDDQRGWYLSLHKSFDQLIALQHKIENEHLPGMIETARDLALIDLDALSPAALGLEIKRRWEINQRWSEIYWSDFIPFAHGIRLFGQYYNDRINPDDPYAFIDLLTRTDMQSLERNNLLQELADMVRNDSHLTRNLSAQLDQNPFEFKLKQFLDRFGDLSAGITGSRNANDDLSPLLGLVTEMANRPSPRPTAGGRNSATLKAAYLNSFNADERPRAEALLDLARSSYQLRDDDNIHLGRIEACLLSAIDAGRRRIGQLSPAAQQRDLKTILEQVSPETRPEPKATATVQGRFRFRQRQLVGQPAGPGLVKAKARVIVSADQLLGFKSGEVLVCDAVDPNMTFVVPLAAAIVERRGGMLIHGAIIAREYGIPCITGVPQATAMIQNGDTVTVDGYLGIVTIGKASGI